MLSVSELKKEYGTHLLFERVSFQVRKNDKIGFVGANGAGKTTLFRLLLGQETPDGGAVHHGKETVVAYLEQHAHIQSTGTVWEETMKLFAPLVEMEQQLEQIAAEIEQAPSGLDVLIHRQHVLSEQLEQAGGFTFRSRARAALLGLGFSEAELQQPTTHLSGGQKTRLRLCHILLSNSNLLLLDEPTNHLDIKAVEWLEGFLKEYPGALIVISHDRYFLDKVTNRTFELAAKQLTIYEGNYSRYLTLKTERDQAVARKYENTVREINRIEGIIAQQRQWNRERNIRAAESKQKAIDRLQQTLEKPQEKEKTIHFGFSVRKGSGNDVLMCDGLSMAFGQKRLFDGLDLFLKKGDRVCLLGANGCGKTTLMRMITGETAPQAGTIRLGANVEIGYFDQTQNNLDTRKTAFEEVSDAFPSFTQTQVRNALAAFLFRGDDVFQPIATMSGGERARVALAKLMLSGANLLLLDEPTNHLDIASREALENALEGYEGTCLVISHDRYFINKLANRICVMKQDGLTWYDGNYDDYQSQQASQQAAPQLPGAGKEDYLLAKQRQAKERKKQADLERLEQSIEQVEQQIKQIEQVLAGPECATDYVKAMEQNTLLEQAEKKRDTLYLEWEKLCLE